MTKNKNHLTFDQKKQATSCRGVRFHYYTVFTTLLLCLTGLASMVGAQNFATRTPLSDSWKIEVKGGTGFLLSSIPEKYLERINNVSMPVFTPGVSGVFAVKKGLFGHLEMGYQMDLIYVQGNVGSQPAMYNVQTSALANNFMILANLKSTRYYRPRTNFSLFYKLGAINLKNIPRYVLPDGTLQEIPDLTYTSFISNVAVGTGIGLSINRQFTEHFSFTGAIELNRTSDNTDDLYRPSRLFYQSESTVNNYMMINAGICYTFNFTRKTSPVFHRRITETEKRLIQHRKIKRSRKYP